MTRNGDESVYVIRYAINVHKIGVSREPKVRLIALKAEGWPGLELIKTWRRPDGDAYQVEGNAHHILSRYRNGDSPRARERFNVSAECACMAVDLAIKLMAEMPKERTLQPSPLVRPGPDPMPIQKHRSGYVQLRSGEYSNVFLEALRAQGVMPNRVYIDYPGEPRRPAVVAYIRSLREGDESFIARRDDLTPEMVEEITRKGVSLLDLPWPDSIST